MRHLVNAYEVEADWQVRCTLQVTLSDLYLTLCDLYLSALSVRYYKKCAI